MTTEDEFAEFIGQNITMNKHQIESKATIFGMEVRYLTPDVFGIDDYRTDRINVNVDNLGNIISFDVG